MSIVNNAEEKQILSRLDNIDRAVQKIAENQTAITVKNGILQEQVKQLQGEKGYTRISNRVLVIALIIFTILAGINISIEQLLNI